MVYTNAVSLKSGLSTVFAECVTFGIMYLLTSLASQFVTGGFNPIWYGYIGNLISFSLSTLGSAYAVTKIVYAYVSLAKTDHGTSYGYSGEGNNIHLIEFINTVMFVLWALSIAVFGFLEANMVWRNFTIKAANGVEMVMMEGYKYLAMQMVIGISALIAGFLVGDIACGLLGFFDNYDVT